MSWALPWLGRGGATPPVAPPPLVGGLLRIGATIVRELEPRQVDRTAVVGLVGDVIGPRTEPPSTSRPWPSRRAAGNRPRTVPGRAWQGPPAARRCCAPCRPRAGTPGRSRRLAAGARRPRSGTRGARGARIVGERLRMSSEHGRWFSRPDHSGRHAALTHARGGFTLCDAQRSCPRHPGDPSCRAPAREAAAESLLVLRSSSCSW